MNIKVKMFISKIFISVLVLCFIECSYGTVTEMHPNVKLLPKSCGDNDGKINLGGMVPTLYEFPWMALISYITRFGTDFKCSGTIINSKYILTAAHCVSENLKIAGVRIGEFDIRYRTDCQGEEPRIVCESHLQDIRVEKIISHPNFNIPAMKNDIALIRLKEPINFNYKNAMPICLPVTQELQNSSLAGTTGIVAGWGLADAKTSYGSLLKAGITINTADECPSLSDTEEVLKEICAGKNQINTCIGDSGSPLMVVGLYEGTDRYIQYGIVSRGPRKCGSAPGVYTDVTKYMGWILDNIEE